MVRWCCAVSMVTGTKACGWPLMANCILHSSFVNCCLPSSYFLLGRGTKPRTGGIRNGTSAQPPGSYLRFSIARLLLSPCRVCSPDPVKSFLSLGFFFPSEHVFTSSAPFSAGCVGTTDPSAQTFRFPTPPPSRPTSNF